MKANDYGLDISHNNETIERTIKSHSYQIQQLFSNIIKDSVKYPEIVKLCIINTYLNIKINCIDNNSVNIENAYNKVIEFNKINTISDQMHLSSEGKIDKNKFTILKNKLIQRNKEIQERNKLNY